MNSTDADDNASRQPANLPTPVVRKSRWPFPIIWLVPLLAALAAGYYLYDLYGRQGPEVLLTFDDADGLRPRDTPLTFHGVRVGRVSRVGLTDERDRALVAVRVEPGFEGVVARDGAKFWIVRPGLGGGMLTGLNTVISGPYLEVQPGAGGPRFRFEGNDSRPVRLGDGLRVILHTDRLAHVQSESPVFFRGLQVGAVQDIRFSSDASQVNVTIFIYDRYARLVRRGSRFWVATGTDIKGGLLKGISVEVNNLQALLAGGVAFATPDDGDVRPVEEGTDFTLHESADKDWLNWSAKIDLALKDNPGQTAGKSKSDIGR